MPSRRLTTLVAGAALVAGAIPAATALPLLGSKGPVGSEEPTPRALVFNGEGNRLNVYDTTDPTTFQTLHVSADDALDGATPDGVVWTPDSGIEAKDSNAQICFTDLGGQTHFVIGEDTGQGDQGGTAVGGAGWGIFALDGDRVGELASAQVAKLVPNFGTDVEATNKNENYGCAFLPNGNLLLTDVGSQRPGEPGTGQLHLWFRDGPDYSDFGRDDYLELPRVTQLGGASEILLPIPVPGDVDYCLIDTGIPTAGEIEVTTDHLTGETVALVASARPGNPDQLLALGGIWKYKGLDELTAADCADGAGLPAERTAFHSDDHPDHPAEANLARYTAEQLNGTPMVDAGVVGKSLFIFDPLNSPTPNGIAESSYGTYFVTSVFTGTITEYSPLGLPLRRVLTPRLTSPIPPYADTGTPLGIDIDPHTGDLWFADIGIGGVEDAVFGTIDAILSGDFGGIAGAFGAIGPSAEGHVRRLVHDHGPSIGPATVFYGGPETVHGGRAFPDGIGILDVSEAG